MIGIPTFFYTSADVPVTSSVVPVTVGLKSAVAKNQKQSFRITLVITVGATGGVRVIVAVPAGGVLFINTIVLQNTVAPSTTTAVQTSSAAFTNALANAGTHFLIIEGSVENGATAGNIDVQVAQNTSDALTLTVKKGSFMTVVSQ